MYTFAVLFNIIMKLSKLKVFDVIWGIVIKLLEVEAFFVVKGVDIRTIKQYHRISFWDIVGCFLPKREIYASLFVDNFLKYVIVVNRI